MPNPFAGQTAQEAHVEPEVVVPEVNGSEQVSSTERTFSTADVEQIVKDRLAREQKKFAKERSEWESKLAPKVVSSNVEEDLRNKLSAYESEKKQLSEKLTKYQQDNLRAQVERKLSAAECLDPEVVIDHFMSRNLVHLDEDGQMVVENATGSLDDLVTDYLFRKPHLRRASVSTGVGSKAPSRPVAASGSPSEMTTDELRQQMGFGDTKKKNPFSR
jgi:hypothetical protein